MIQKQKNKMNLQILAMLRDKGAPRMSPFPGEQDFETTDLDLDALGDVLIAKNRIGPEEEESSELPKPPKKKIKIPTSSEEEE